MSVADDAVEVLATGVQAGQRAKLAQAITLVESSLPEHQRQAQALLSRLLPCTGGAKRVGITGVPGVGKSTFIDQLGQNLIAAGHSVAVLAIDPSSRRSGGSIMGDKTRMVGLSRRPEAFIRPSPSAGSLGGVARKTRESILLCEAAGFDVVLVETVGVGQSETAVAEMVDFFLALLLAEGGDELQGIKRGLLERVDMVAINKADGDGLQRAERAQQEYRTAFHYLRPRRDAWSVPVVTCSALANTGLESLWAQIEQRLVDLERQGELLERRQAQQVQWMWSLVEQQLFAALRAAPEVTRLTQELEAQVRAGSRPATAAAADLLAAFRIPSHKEQV